MLFYAQVCTVSLACIFLSQVSGAYWGGLYPRESISREVRSLDGLWNFRLSPLKDPEMGFREKWYSKPLSKTGRVRPMPVPSSYNDVTQDKELRDHIGWAWYDRTFIIPMRWLTDNQRIVLRLGSAHYNSIVYINGRPVTSHEGGHLPVAADITTEVLFGQENFVTVTINNTLTPATLPQGQIVHHNDTTMYPEGYFQQTYNFDFTNYAGLHRPVYIYTTPQTYIDDVSITTEIQDTDGIIKYEILHATTRLNETQFVECVIHVVNNEGDFEQRIVGCAGTIVLKNATFWWPYLMSNNPGYMYTLIIELSDAEGITDVYHQNVGIRTIGWNSTTLTINNKPMYLRGCGKHEDSDLRGKGVDYPLIVKDFSLLKWLGANSFRTSHYPYAEEIMDMADQEGIMVIDESPAIGLTGFDTALMNKHISVMQEFVRRDKNRPSVIMWSVGNEPQSDQAAAKDYFKEVVTATKIADPTRPVTCVLSVNKSTDKAAASLDIVLVNRYYSWYSDTGHLELIKMQTETEFEEWHMLYNVPVMISEYGAGSISGFHTDPAFTWTEDYQAALMFQNFLAFDTLRAKGYFVGEMIWNFADFATPQEYNRPGACMKGLFTRQRQPKLAGHVMRYRYWSLAEKIDNATLTPELHDLQFGFMFNKID